MLILLDRRAKEKSIEQRNSKWREVVLISLSEGQPKDKKGFGNGKKNVHNMIWISQCVQVQQKSVITSCTPSFYRWRNINLKGFIQFHVEPEAELGFLTFSCKSFGLLWILHTELCYGKKLLIILWQDLIFFFLKVFLNTESKE